MGRRHNLLEIALSAVLLFCGILFVYLGHPISTMLGVISLFGGGVAAGIVGERQAMETWRKARESNP